MIKINGNSLTLNDVVLVSRFFEPVELDEKSIKAINKSREYVEKILKENRVVYGITTGVGELSNQLISPEDAVKLQLNLVRSHSTNVGEPLSEDVVRGIILLRANALAKGYSGVRVELIQMLILLLNKNIYPYIPAKGSVGASGDLSPLAHLALVLIGEGECMVKSKRVDTMEVLEEIGIKPLTLQPKEGLALINGTQVMASIGCLVVPQVLHQP